MTASDDARWFEQHRHRSYRLRFPLPGELPDTRIVRQLTSGVRMCALVRLDDPEPGDDEETTRALFEEAKRFSPEVADIERLAGQRGRR